MCVCVPMCVWYNQIGLDFFSPKTSILIQAAKMSSASRFSSYDVYVILNAQWVMIYEESKQITNHSKSGDWYGFLVTSVRANLGWRPARIKKITSLSVWLQAIGCLCLDCPEDCNLIDCNFM